MTASASSPERDAASLAVIAAVARNGVIGAGNALPWRLPEDLKRFRALTIGHTVIMGRRTWDSLPRALAGRQNIVVTRRDNWLGEGADAAQSFADALTRVRLPAPAYCIGGGELYAASLPYADTLHITEIERDFDGDARFPEFDRNEWRETTRISGRSDDGLDYAFVTYVRTAKR